MRKITLKTVNAFMNGQNMTSGNVSVLATGNGIEYRLHGNLIARKDGELIYIKDAGWQTATTKDRLNAILDHCSAPRIFQKDFAWYYSEDDKKMPFESNTWYCVSDNKIYR